MLTAYNSDDSPLYGTNLGSLGDAAVVTRLQQALKNARYSITSPATGVVDNNTAAAVVDFVVAVSGAISSSNYSAIPSTVKDGVGLIKSWDNWIHSNTGWIPVLGPLHLSSFIRTISAVQAGIDTFVAFGGTVPAGVGNVVGTVNGYLTQIKAFINSHAAFITTAVGIMHPGSVPSTTTTPGTMTFMQIQSAPPASSPPATSGNTTTTTTPERYPTGTITAFSTRLGKWRIAIPAGTSITPARTTTASVGPVLQPALTVRASGVSNLGSLGVTDAAGRCVYGDCGLGAAAPAFTEVAPATTQPSGAAVVDENTLNKNVGATPFYKTAWFWGAVGGVVVLGGGAWFVLRKKKGAGVSGVDWSELSAPRRYRRRGYGRLSCVGC